ncbi:myomegalin [Plectropomus leopardus]|uniref:myomegalin n=1 Tax=Plectropomus leopardus TaxID=160734 RepID=UPI001C4CED4F|nr:myomegalin [Plectropomus leopardus]
MLDVVKMKEACRICARELCGNQRRWIFHPTAKLNLQVLLSHALGHELTRDGRGEFACSKCAFMLDRMYRFDTVIARVEVLSLERLHKLLLEKDRLRQCIGGLYRKNNTEDESVAPSGSVVGVVGTDAVSEDSPVVDLSDLQDGKYSDMVQDDLTYSVYESWADKEDSAVDHHTHHHHHHHLQCPSADPLSGQKPRRCRGCAALRVADSDYEAVCKVPRKVGRRSTSCGPSTRYSAATPGVEDPPRASGESEATTVAFEASLAELDTDKTMCDRTSPSPASSVESLDTAVDISCPPVNRKEREETEPEEAPVRRDTPWDKSPSESSLSGLDMTLSLLKSCEYRPVKPRRGSKLPVLVKAKLKQCLLLSLPTPLRSPCGGATDFELYPHRPVPEVVIPCPQQELQAELAEMEEQWLDDYVECGPFRFQQRLIDEQQGQLSQYESAAGQCVGELQKAQDQVRSLQAKIRESETRNQKLQERLGDMELELRSAQEEAQRQERNIQNITDTANSKEAEAAELYRVIEEQNKMLCSLKELSNRNQLQQLQVAGADSIRGQGEVLALQASLFQAQLELQAGQRAQRQAGRTQEDLNRALQRLEQDLQGALQHRRETERHNQDLQLALEKTRSALQEREEQLREAEQERRRQAEEREKTIRELKTSLQTKEQLIEDYCELLEDPKEKRDSLLQKLRQRIKERDRALERAVDDKFRCVEEKEEETRRLQLLLREKERDLERQRCVLANNEETITSLEVLVRGKALELEQVCDAWRNVQRQQQGSEERQSSALRERDSIISQLQAALHARTQEAQDLRCTLLAQIQTAPSDVLEELKVRLQLKDRLFQDVLADRTLEAQEHQEQVQNLLRTISSRDQYIQDSAGRLSEVMTEQTGRLQELRRQLSSGVGSRTDSGADSAVELQALQEELRLALRREKESQELSRSQAGRVDSLTRTLCVKEEIIRDFQRQMAEPSALSLVERLTLEVQELRESLVQRDGPPARGPILGRDRPNSRQPEFGELSSEDEDEADDDLNSECTESVDEEESKLQSVANTKNPGASGKAPAQELLFEGQGLMEVKQLVEQKRVVERELGELKAQLEKAGFSSLSQMRKALFSLQAENGDLKHQLSENLQPDSAHTDEQKMLDAEEDEDEVEEELDVTIEGAEEDEEEESSEMWDAWDSELSLSQSNIQSSAEQRANRPESLQLSSSSQHVLDSELSADQQQGAASSTKCEKTVRLQQKSKELQERLMVSEATVQAQAEQLKDYRELLTETAVQQDSKQIQVDLQDLGYETCGRSENEAEREDTSSPEFDDLEMCTSLDCGSQWWPAGSSSSSFTKTTTQSSADGDEMSSLQRLVEDLRSQLSRSQGVIRGLQSRLRSLSTSSDYGPSTPRKVNWSFQASPSQSGAEDDEGWQSSDGGPLASPRHPHPEKGLQELVSRVDALEDQLRKGGKKAVSEDVKSATWPGKFDTLIQAQARELSHLRQRLREGRGVCNILTQHLGDTTKAFEELLRANDIDYYMGQSFRDQLAQSGALAQRVSAKISGRDHPEDPDEKTELLAIRLSKELQQKDKVIESLRAKLNQHHHHHRSDTPCSSHALSDTTDQSDRISYVSDEHGSTHDDLDLCSEMDAASELGQKEARSLTRVSTDCHSHSGTLSHHSSVPPSIASSHRAQSCLSCPSMHCPSSPHKPADMQSQTAPASFFTSAPFHPPPSSSTFTQRAPLPFHAHPVTPRTRYQGNGGVGFSLAEVHQELQMLQRQLRDTERFSTPQSKPLQAFPFAHQQPDPSAFLPLSYHGYQPSPFSSATSGGLDASSAMKAGSSLLESSALWDLSYGTRPVRLGADLSSGSSGYQSGTSNTGSDLMKEHLREIRSLRQRLEDSIQTNDRLRQQLEERLARTATEKGAPTNIYIQGLDSVSQLSSEIRLLKEENISLQNQLKQASRESSKEAEQLKKAELEAERWAEKSRKLQDEADARSKEIAQLKLDRQKNQETINRLQHELSVLQQQLCESRSLVHSLQCELQVYHRVCGVDTNSHKGQASDNAKLGLSTATFDPRELHIQLEQQLSGQADTQPRTRRQLFNENVPSPPVRDTGLVSPSSPLHPVQKHAEAADQAASSLQGQAPNGSFASRHGRHAVGHIDDFKALQQQILEGSALLNKMDATLYSLSTPQEFSLHQPSGSGSVRKLLSDSETLRQILEEADSLLRMFWRAALPNCEETKQV